MQGIRHETWIMSKNTAAHNTHVLTSTLHVEKYNNKTNMCKNNLCIVKKVIIQESDIFPLVISQKRSSPFTWGFTWPALRSRKLWTNEITRKLTVTLSGVFHGGVALKSSSWSTSPYQTKESVKYQRFLQQKCHNNKVNSARSLTTWLWMGWRCTGASMRGGVRRDRDCKSRQSSHPSKTQFLPKTQILS